MSKGISTDPKSMLRQIRKNKVFSFSGLWALAQGLLPIDTTKWWRLNLIPKKLLHSQSKTFTCIFIYTRTLATHVIFTRNSNFIYTYISLKTRILHLSTRVTSFHVYVLEWYDICMVRCDAQREWHVTGSALSWRIVLSRCDIITLEVVLKVISVGTPAIRHIYVNNIIYKLTCDPFLSQHVRRASESHRCIAPQVYPVTQYYTCSERTVIVSSHTFFKFFFTNK